MSKKVSATLITLNVKGMEVTDPERVFMDLLLELGFSEQSAWWICTQVVLGREHVAIWRKEAGEKAERQELDCDRLWRLNPHSDIRPLMLQLGFLPPEVLEADKST